MLNFSCIHPIYIDFNAYFWKNYLKFRGFEQ